MSRDSPHDLILKALGDARRREMLDLLREKPRTTGELCDYFKRRIDRCTVMQHLGVLEKADLVIVKRSGRFRWNYINLLPIKDLHDRWISGYAEEAIDLLARMKWDMEEHANLGLQSL